MIILKKLLISSFVNLAYILVYLCQIWYCQEGGIIWYIYLYVALFSRHTILDLDTNFGYCFGLF